MKLIDTSIATRNEGWETREIDKKVIYSNGKNVNWVHRMIILKSSLRLSELNVWVLSVDINIKVNKENWVVTAREWVMSSTIC